MARTKNAKTKNRSKGKSTRRALNAFDIAQNQVNSKFQDSDSDDGAIVNPRKGSDDEEEGEFEDEELDSDEALGSDDDFDVLNSKFSQTIRDQKKERKNKKRNDEIDSDDGDDDGYASVDEAEFLPLSAVWDLDDSDLNKNKGKDIVLDDNLESESEIESESESESEIESDEEEFPENDEELSENEDYDEEEEVELKTLKSQLSKTMKKSKKQYENLHIQENELSLPGGGQDITLADMLSVVDQQESSKAILIEKEDDANRALAVPLPRRIQERHERKAAYEISKDEVNKWKDTVKQNRQAEVLSFPLNPQVQHNAVSTFSETIPLTELEKRVNSVLTESALLDDKQESKFEEIATAKMSMEELRKRQNELRRMRELMFRQEREAKRIKKIKSKSYRRVKKKEMLKNQALIEGGSDNEDHDARRAQERMSLKHKTNSKWAQSMIKSGMSKDEDAREEMEEMLKRGERLKSRILDNDDSAEEFSDREEVHNEDLEKVGKTGVLNMAFMKNAEGRAKQANNETRAQIHRLNNAEDLKEFEEQEASGVDVNVNTGRRIYTPSAKNASKRIKEVNDNVIEENQIDKSKDLSNRLKKKHSILEKTQEVLNETNEKKTPDEDINPWLVGETVQKSQKIRVIDSSSSKLDKAESKISKKQKRKASELDEDDDNVIDMESTLKVTDPYADESIKEFQQKELLQQAFAGDDIMSEFKQEKKKHIKDEGDQVEDLTLPGWGDWAGGNKKSKKKKVVKITKGVKYNDRKDKNLQNVIINEKLNKKNMKYQSSAVPFPYENREQYERSLRMPIGQEWTSRESHQRLTMPKVIIKTGVVIDPLKKPN